MNSSRETLDHLRAALPAVEGAAAACESIAKPSAAPRRAIASMRSRALARSPPAHQISAAPFDFPSIAMLTVLSLQLLRDDNDARQQRNRYF
jgi:hypothetical protein